MLSDSWAAALLPALLGNALVQKGQGICPSLWTYELFGADREILLLGHPNACEVYRFLTALQCA